MENSQFLSIKLLSERTMCFGTFGIKKKNQSKIPVYSSNYWAVELERF